MNELKIKILEIINKINEKNPYYLIGIIVFVLILADYFCVLRFQLSILNNRKGLITEITTFAEELKRGKTNIQNMPQNQQEKQKIQEELSKINSQIRTKEEIQIVLENISKMANKNGVVIEKIVPRMSIAESVLANSEGKYSSIPIQIEAKSSYHAFARFVNQLENQEVFLRIPRFTIEAVKEDPTHHSIEMEIGAIVFEKI